MINEKLYALYLEMRGPDCGLWNLSPKNLYLEHETRHYVSTEFEIFDGIKVCNVGIGVGEWDDYLGYWLNGKGTLTSIDINPEIGELFPLRQKIEGHPNPSIVLCEDVLATTAEPGSFDIVTIIGSALRESEKYYAVLNKCFDLLKPGGYLMYMDMIMAHSAEDFQEFIATTPYKIVDKQSFTKYPDMEFYIYKAKKE